MEKDLINIRKELIGANVNMIYKATGVHTNTLYKIRRGRKDISARTISTLVEYFDIK